MKREGRGAPTTLPLPKRQLVISILEVDFGRVVEAARLSGLTPETYAQRIFYAGLEGVRAKFIGVDTRSEPAGDADTLPAPVITPPTPATFAPPRKTAIELERERFVSKAAHIRWLIATTKLTPAKMARRAGCSVNNVYAYKADAAAQQRALKSTGEKP